MSDTAYLPTMQLVREDAELATAAANDPVAPSRPALPSERRLIGIGIGVIAGLLATLAAWSWLAPIHGAVIVQGYAAVANERKLVQHLEGGIVKEILVAPGTQVQAGQPLIRLQEVQANAAATAIRTQLDADLVRVARLHAEQTGSALALPDEVASRRAEPAVASIIATEQMLMQTRRKALDEQIGLVRADSRHIAAEIRSIETLVEQADKGIRYAQEQLSLNEQLQKENFVAPAKVLEYRSQLNDRSQRRAEAQAQVAQARQKITQNDLKIESLRQAFMKEAADDLRQTERRVDELRERLRPSIDALARSTIVAPVAGEVIDLRVHTIGGVITPRETLMSIVPHDASVVVKGRARPEDILHLHPGADVDVQLTAYKRKTTPVVKGRLAYVSGDMLVENTPGASQPYYEVRIEIDPQELAWAGDLHILPGMPVEAFIQTEARSVFQYLIQPLVQSMRHAGRET